MAVVWLNDYGADPTTVPDRLGAIEEIKRWQRTRARQTPVQLWKLDYIRAILEQIPVRRPRGRIPNRDTLDAQNYVDKGVPPIEAARRVVRAWARREHFWTGIPISDDELEAAVEKLARRIYRKRRKRELP